MVERLRDFDGDWLRTSCVDDDAETTEATNHHFHAPAAALSDGGMPVPVKRTASWDSLNDSRVGTCGAGDGEPSTVPRPAALLFWVPSGLATVVPGAERFADPRCRTENGVGYLWCDERWPSTDAPRNSAARPCSASSAPRFGTALPPPLPPPHAATSAFQASPADDAVVSASQQWTTPGRRSARRESWDIRSSSRADPSGVFNELHNLLSPEDLRALLPPQPLRRSGVGGGEAARPQPPPGAADRLGSGGSADGALSAGGAERSIPAPRVSLLCATSQLLERNRERERLKGVSERAEQGRESATGDSPAAGSPPRGPGGAASELCVRSVQDWQRQLQEQHESAVAERGEEGERRRTSPKPAGQPLQQRGQRGPFWASLPLISSLGISRPKVAPFAAPTAGAADSSIDGKRKSSGSATWAPRDSMEGSRGGTQGSCQGESSPRTGWWNLGGSSCLLGDTNRKETPSQRGTAGRGPYALRGSMRAFDMLPEMRPDLRMQPEEEQWEVSAGAPRPRAPKCGQGGAALEPQRCSLDEVAPYPCKKASAARSPPPASAARRGQFGACLCGGEA